MIGQFYKFGVIFLFMILKQVPEDFVVREVFDLDSFDEKLEEGKVGKFFYFLLRKREFNQLRAIDIVADCFNVSRKMVHFAGTKDKVGVTFQVISVFGLREENLERNVEYINSSFEDLEVSFLGRFSGRVNLGDNLGNKFSIVVRGLSCEDCEVCGSNFERISEFGVLNLFDSQRFGFANNSHIIGKFILQNDARSAVYEILTSCPPEPTEDLKRFVDAVCESWEAVVECDVSKIDELIELVPRQFRDYKRILLHLRKARNDFPGAFRTLMKKLRTLYVHAFQSYVFNECVRRLDESGDLGDFSKVNVNPMDSNSDTDDSMNHGVKFGKENFFKLELVNNLTDFSKLDAKVLKIVELVFAEFGVCWEDLQLRSWPELRSKFKVFRDTRVFVKGLRVGEFEDDDLNSGQKKVLVEFELGSGQYATNVVKQLFER